MNSQELKDYTKNSVNYCRWFKEEEAMEGLAYYKLKFMELAAKVLSMDDGLVAEHVAKSVKPKINDIVKKPTNRCNWSGQSKTDGFTILDKQFKNINWVNQRQQQVEELYREAVSKGQEITPDVIQRIAQIVGTTSPCVRRIIDNI